MLHHRLQAPTWVCDCFSRTEQCRVQHFNALLWGRVLGLSLAESFKIWVLNTSLRPEIKHRRTVALGMPLARQRHVEGRDLMKAWYTREETVRFSVRAS